ncbi:MAG TPA: glucosaminidase domain-containing protein [Vineibacter sp.]|nr:glucosaminidase domain-containing protein [Vineibacter sp.]
MTPEERRTWVLAMIEAARATAARINISPEAIVAQAALESGWGRKGVGNNIFGIKAGPGWTGRRRLSQTREVLSTPDHPFPEVISITKRADGKFEYVVKDWFRDYDSWADCIADHFAFLDKGQHYQAAGVFDGNGDEAYFHALQRAGYATDPLYAQRLCEVLGSVRAVAGTAPGSQAVRDLRIGMVGDDVQLLQSQLNARGDYMLEVDREFGSLTLLAVKHFQRQHGIPDSGTVDAATRAALGLAAA